MAVVGLFDDDEDERRKRRAMSTPGRPGPVFNQTALFQPPTIDRTTPGPSQPPNLNQPRGPFRPSFNGSDEPDPYPFVESVFQNDVPYQPPEQPAPPQGISPPQTSDERRDSLSKHVSELYAQLLGRSASAGEIASDVENYERYGGDQLRANLRERGANSRGTDANVPGAPAGTLRQVGGQSDAQQASSAMDWQPGPGTFERTATMFDDPGTSQLEKLLNAQLEALNRPNPQLTQLMDFLNKQFSELSSNPGFSPEELAIQRTQAFEPLEAYRHASKQRAIERAGARGFLPSSGLHELDLRDIDIGADRNRSALDRDLAIRGMDERKSDLARALQMAQGAFEIPAQDERNRFGDQLSRSSLLYELPRNAMRDSLAVLGSTPGPESLFNQSVQLQQMQQQRDFINQQRNAQTWTSIGQILPSIMGLFD